MLAAGGSPMGRSQSGNHTQQRGVKRRLPANPDLRLTERRPPLAGSSSFHDLGCKYPRPIWCEWSRVARYKASQLRRFQRNSHCEYCVHYTDGCPLWMAILLSNEEDKNTPGLDLTSKRHVQCSSPPLRPFGRHPQLRGSTGTLDFRCFSHACVLKLALWHFGYVLSR
jgi:hypothetical protein